MFVNTNIAHKVPQKGDQKFLKYPIHIQNICNNASVNMKFVQNVTKENYL